MTTFRAPGRGNRGSAGRARARKPRTLRTPSFIGRSVLEVAGVLRSLQAQYVALLDFQARSLFGGQPLAKKLHIPVRAARAPK